MAEAIDEQGNERAPAPPQSPPRLPEAIAFLTEFSINTQIFNQILLPALVSSVNVLLDHQGHLNRLNAHVGMSKQQVLELSRRVEEFEKLVTTSGLSARSADNPNFVREERVTVNGR